MKRPGGKFFSITIVALLVAMIAGFNLSFYLLFTQSRRVVDSTLGDRLISIARAIAPEISSDLKNDLILGELSLTTITRLRSYFEQISSSDDLYGIYLLDNGNHDLLSLGDSISTAELFASLHTEHLSRAHLGDDNVSSLYQVDDRYFKAAFYPVGGDSTVAVLVVESSFQFFEEFSTFRKNIFYVNVIAVAFLLVVGSVIVLLNRRLIRAEKLLISQAALSQMGQMAAVIAHEIRNPLAIIKATAERLEKKYQHSGEDDELFSYIPDEVRRLNLITSNYLQFAAPTAAKSKLEPVEHIVQSVITGIMHEFKEKHVNLTSDLNQQAGQLPVDSSQLRQILINLLRNALEATEKNGEVQLRVDTQQKHGAIKITVEDNGSGLNRSEVKRIFDPFFTTKTQGSGLGLFVVHRLVDNLGWRIKVDSTKGIGTKFVIEIQGDVDG